MITMHQSPKFFLIILCGLLLFLAPVSAFGLSLDQAKHQGLLGERPDGYLGIAKSSAPPEAVALMKDINRKRREVYKGIAKKNGTELSAVEALAGKKAIQKTPSGQAIMQPNGTWIQKP